MPKKGLKVGLHEELKIKSVKETRKSKKPKRKYRALYEGNEARGNNAEQEDMIIDSIVS